MATKTAVGTEAIAGITTFCTVSERQWQLLQGTPPSRLPPLGLFHGWAQPGHPVEQHGEGDLDL
jgi:hypothetical protein